MVRKIFYLIFVLVSIYTISGCLRRVISNTEIDIYIDSETEPSNIEIIIRDDVFPAGYLDSIHSWDKESYMNTKSLPGDGNYIVYEILDYVDSVRQTDTGGTYIIPDVEDGIYTLRIRVINEETDSLVNEYEEPMLIIEESYNRAYEKDSGYVPILTLSPEGYEYKIEDFPVSSIPITVSSDTFYVELPFKFCCRDLTTDKEIWKDLKLRIGDRNIINFNLKN